MGIAQATGVKALGTISSSVASKWKPLQGLKTLVKEHSCWMQRYKSPERQTWLMMKPLHKDKPPSIWRTRFARFYSELFFNFMRTFLLSEGNCVLRSHFGVPKMTHWALCSCWRFKFKSSFWYKPKPSFVVLL